MKAMMYHYVRPDQSELPFFNHLHIDDFKRQLDHFDHEYGFVSQEAFLDSFESGNVPRGVILTFDDGLRDHYEFVLPELVARGLWAIFYVPGLPFVQERLLDVHRVHLLIGMFGGARVLPELEKLITVDMLTHAHRAEFTSHTYATYDDEEATKTVKRILNYFIDSQSRDRIFDQLFEQFGIHEAEARRGYYMTPEELHAMHEAGMIVGAHSMSHRVMSTLSTDEQQGEISESFSVLEKALGRIDVKTYCHPYGRAHSYNADTIRILNQEHCLFSFDVNSRDIEGVDVLSGRQALPRYNCNEFPHGSVRRSA